MPTIGIDLAHLDGKIRHTIGYQGDIIPEGETSPAANFGLESPPQSPPQAPPILPSGPKTLAQFLSNLHRDIESNIVGVGMLGYLPLEYVWNIGDRLGTALRKGGIQAAKIESDNIAQELVQAGINIPSQAIKMGKAVIGETKQTITHPIQSFYDRPLSTILTAANIAGLAALAKEPAAIAAKRLINVGKLTNTDAIRILKSQKGFARYSADDLDKMFNNWDELIQEGERTPTAPNIGAPAISELQSLSQQTGLGQSQIFNIATSIYRPSSQPITLQEFLRHPTIHQAISGHPDLKEAFINNYNQIRSLPEAERERIGQQLGMPAQTRIRVENEPRYTIQAGTSERRLQEFNIEEGTIITHLLNEIRDNIGLQRNFSDLRYPIDTGMGDMIYDSRSPEEAIRRVTDAWPRNFELITRSNRQVNTERLIRQVWQRFHQPPSVQQRQP